MKMLHAGQCSTLVCPTEISVASANDPRTESTFKHIYRVNEQINK